MIINYQYCFIKMKLVVCIFFAILTLSYSTPKTSSTSQDNALTKQEKYHNELIQLKQYLKMHEKQNQKLFDESKQIDDMLRKIKKWSSIDIKTFFDQWITVVNSFKETALKSQETINHIQEWLESIQKIADKNDIKQLNSITRYIINANYRLKGIIDKLMTSEIKIEPIIKSGNNERIKGFMFDLYTGIYFPTSICRISDTLDDVGKLIKGKKIKVQRDNDNGKQKESIPVTKSTEFKKQSPYKSDKSPLITNLLNENLDLLEQQTSSGKQVIQTVDKVINLDQNNFIIDSNSGENHLILIEFLKRLKNNYLITEVNLLDDKIIQVLNNFDGVLHGNDVQLFYHSVQDFNKQGLVYLNRMEEMENFIRENINKLDADTKKELDQIIQDLNRMSSLVAETTKKILSLRENLVKFFEPMNEFLGQEIITMRNDLDNYIVFRALNSDIESKINLMIQMEELEEMLK